MTYQDPWAGLPLDPRLPEHAHIRAADRDRDAVAATRTLGELPALVSDLLPPTAAVARRAGLAPDAIRARAVEKYESDRRAALWTMLSATSICLVIWIVGGLGPDGLDLGFPWPLFVLLGTGLHYAKTRFDRQERVEGEVRRLERKAAKQVRKALPPPESPA